MSAEISIPEGTTDSALPHGPVTSPGRWLWPFPRVSAHTAHRLEWAARLGLPWLERWDRLIAVGLALGVLPVLGSYALHLPGHQLVTSLLLFPFFLAGVRAELPTRTLGFVGISFLSHSAVVILLSMREGAEVAPLFPGAESFWVESRAWVEHGANPAYDLRAWLPTHLLLACLVLLLAYCSLGLTVLIRGFHEVDLMNYYVGRLLAESSHAGPALLYGWHVWSLLRGLGCALLLYEITSLSFGRLTGMDSGRGSGRRLRLAIGAALLVLDGLLKYLLMDTVQARLQANLL